MKSFSGRYLIRRTSPNPSKMSKSKYAKPSAKFVSSNLLMLLSLDFRAFLFGCLALLVGIQALTFGLITRSFAARNGLLPNRAETQRWLAHLTVERLLQAAAILGILGIGGLGLTIGAWGRHGFGEFPGEQMLRGLSLSATAVAAAMQLGFSSFLLGVIELPPREDARARLTRLRAHFQNFDDES